MTFRCKARAKSSAIRSTSGVLIGIAVLALGMAGAIAEPLKVTITTAGVDFDQRTKEPVVTFEVSGDTRKLFATLTEKNIGRKMEIRIDGKPVLASVIREPLLGRSVQISGRYTEQQARDIAERLSSSLSRLELEIVD